MVEIIKPDFRSTVDRSIPSAGIEPNALRPPGQGPALSEPNLPPLRPAGRTAPSVRPNAPRGAVDPRKVHASQVAAHRSEVAALLGRLNEPDFLEVSLGQAVSITTADSSGRHSVRLLSITDIDHESGLIRLRGTGSAEVMELTPTALAENLAAREQTGWSLLERADLLAPEAKSRVQALRPQVAEATREMYELAVRSEIFAREGGVGALRMLSQINERIAELEQRQTELGHERYRWRAEHSHGPAHLVAAAVTLDADKIDSEGLRDAPQAAQLLSIISQLAALRQAAQNLVLGDDLTSGLDGSQVLEDPVLYGLAAVEAARDDTTAPTAITLAERNLDFLLQRSEDAPPVEVLMAYHGVVAPYLEQRVDGESFHHDADGPSLTRAINGMIDRGIIDNGGKNVTSAAELRAISRQVMRHWDGVESGLEILRIGPVAQSMRGPLATRSYLAARDRRASAAVRQEIARLTRLETSAEHRGFREQGGAELLRVAHAEVEAARTEISSRERWDQAYDVASVTVNDYTFWAMVMVGRGVMGRANGSQALMTTMRNAVARGRVPHRLQQMYSTALGQALLVEGAMFHGGLSAVGMGLNAGFELAGMTGPAHVDLHPEAFVRSMVMMRLLGGAGARHAMSAAMASPGYLGARLRGTALLAEEASWMTLTTVAEAYLRDGRLNLAGDILVHNIQFLLAMRLVGTGDRAIRKLGREPPLADALSRARKAHTEYERAVVNRESAEVQRAHLEKGYEALAEVTTALDRPSSPAPVPQQFFNRLLQAGVPRARVKQASARGMQQPELAHREAGRLLAEAKTVEAVSQLLETFYPQQAGAPIPSAFRAQVGRALEVWRSEGVAVGPMLDVLHARFGLQTPELIAQRNEARASTTVEFLDGYLRIEVQPKNSGYGKQMPREQGGLLSDFVRRAPARAPTEQHVLPEFLRQVIDAKGPILVAGSFPPDADSVGSALALARLLRAQGKEAYAVFDGELPANLAQLGRADLYRSDTLPSGKKFRTVVIVDGAETSGRRIGGVARFVADAETILSIDHHRVGPNPESLGLKPEQRFFSWEETAADSASSMILSLAGHMEAASGAPMNSGQWQRIGEPVAAGILTDRGRGSDHLLRASPEAVGQLRWLMDAKDLKLDATSYRLSWKIPKQVHDQIAQETKFESLPNARGIDGVSVLRARADVVDNAVARDPALVSQARTASHSPKTGRIDVINHLQDVLDLHVPPGSGPANKGQPELGVLVVEVDGGVRFMVRSRTRARLPQELVESVGVGGGKDHLAGGFLKGASADEAVAKLRQWMDAGPEGIVPDSAP